MRVIVQRSKNASCTIDNEVVSKINHGYVLLVGFTHSDDLEICKKMAKKIVNLRIFEDENGKMNKAIKDIGGQILSISQFTLYANPYGGNRPGFTDAMEFNKASQLYIDFCNIFKDEYGIETGVGKFGADMQIALVNDGPVTISLDSVNFK